MIFSLVIIACSVALAAWIIYSVLSFAPWVPTRSCDFGEIARVAGLDELASGSVFVDAGAGDARVIRSLARAYPDIIFRGVEISFGWFLYSQMVFALQKTSFSASNIHMIRGDLYDQKYDDVDVLYMFGVHKTMNGRILREIVPQLLPGAVIISYNFPIDDWSGFSRKHKSKGHATLYEYRVS